MEYKNAYYANKNTGGNDYDFDIKELCDGFSFFDFIHDVQIGNTNYYGGFFVCTPKQYLIGYNARFGSGTHNASYARALKDIKGGGSIISDREIGLLSKECKSKYIYAKLLYESDGVTCSGYIDFDIPQDKISPGMFKSFQKFYEDYYQEILTASEKTHRGFKINFSYGRKKEYIYDCSLDNVYSYIAGIVDDDIIDDEDEIIVGISNKNMGLNLEQKHQN